MEIKKDIRLIALDLDGTVFNSEKIITSRTVAAIEAAIAQGVIVMPASGRTLAALPESFTGIPGVRYAIVSNGAAVYDLHASPEPAVVYKDYMPHDMAIATYEALSSMDLPVCAYSGGVPYCDAKDRPVVLNEKSKFPEWYKRYFRNLKIAPDGIRSLVHSREMQIEKIIALFEDQSLKGHAFARMSRISGLKTVFGLPFNMECSVADKGHSLMEFAKMMNIERRQVMACGDTENDRTMISCAGFSVAMGNADDDIKEAADFITLSNDEDGVAYAIEKFVLLAGVE